MRLVCGLFATVPIVKMSNPLRAFIITCDWLPKQQITNDEKDENYEHRDSKNHCKNCVNHEAEIAEVLLKEIFHNAKVLSVIKKFLKE